MKTFSFLSLFLIPIFAYTNEKEYIHTPTTSCTYTFMIHDLHAISKQLDMFLSLQKYNDYREHRSTFFFTAQRLITESSHLQYINKQNPLIYVMQDILHTLFLHITGFLERVETVEQLRVFPLLIQDYTAYNELFNLHEPLELETIQNSITSILNNLKIDHPTMQYLCNYEQQQLKEYQNAYNELQEEQQTLINTYAQHFTNSKKLMLIVQAIDEYQALNKQIEEYAIVIKDKLYELENFELILKDIENQIISVQKNYDHLF